MAKIIIFTTTIYSLIKKWEHLRLWSIYDCYYLAFACINLTTANIDDTYIKNDDISQSFDTPRKNNHSGTALRDTNTTTNQISIKVYPRQCQQSFQLK